MTAQFYHLKTDILRGIIPVMKCRFKERGVIFTNLQPDGSLGEMRMVNANFSICSIIKHIDPVKCGCPFESDGENNESCDLKNEFIAKLN